MGIERKNIMTSSKKFKQGVILISAIFISTIFYLHFGYLNVAAAPSEKDQVSLSIREQKPLVLYYSRSGKTKIVAEELMQQLNCAMGMIKSTKNRDGFLGVLNCVLDSLLDREDQIEPININIALYSPVVMASPIWIGKLSSPARTFIKQGGLKDKEVYLFISYNGNLTDEKEGAIKKEIASQNITLKGLYKIVTKEKTEDDIRKEVSTLLENIPAIKREVTIAH
jgi:flavodoxin